MQAVRRTLSNTLTKQVRSYHGKSDYVHPNMNELPVPCGDWHEFTKIRNTRHNTMLAAGIAFFTVTLITAKASGLIFLNFSPPDSIE